MITVEGRGGSTMSYGRGPCKHHASSNHVFRNTVTRESCRKLTDWNSASRYNGYSAWIDRSMDRSGSRIASSSSYTYAHTRGAYQSRSRAIERWNRFLLHVLRTYMVRERVFHPRTELPAPWTRIRAPFCVRDRDVSACLYRLWRFLVCGKKGYPCCASRKLWILILVI